MKYLLFLLIFATNFVFAAEQITITSTNYILIQSEITDQSVAKAEMDLMDSCLKKVEDKYLILYSPGGSVTAGGDFIDFVKGQPCKVHTITIFAASMAYQIAQALETRYIMPSGTLMSHRARIGGIGGQIHGELESEVAYFQEMIERYERAVSKRVGISLKEYQDSIRDELWMIGEQAINKGHADKLAAAKCDTSLSGTKSEMISVPFLGKINVIFSKCPLINSPIGFTQATEEQKNKFMEYFRNLGNREVWYK